MTPSTPKDIQTNQFLANLNDQPIPSNYYNFLNYDNDNSNNIPCTPVYHALLYNEGVEDAFMPNDEDINDAIIIDDDDSFVSDIEPPKTNSGN